MTERGIQRLFCQWCPHDCEDREKDPLTQEERDGCVASGGFADAFMGSTVREILTKAEKGMLYEILDPPTNYIEIAGNHPRLKEYHPMWGKRLASSSIEGESDGS